MPFSQDILFRIVNVHWGGLAVEFGDKDRGPGEPEPETRSRKPELNHKQKPQ